MFKLIMWLLMGRWLVISTYRDWNYLFQYKRNEGAKEFYLALVQNNFCSSRDGRYSAFIRRDMSRIMKIQEEEDG